MTFVESIKSVYSNYATFSGRASRSEFWWFTLFYTVVFIALYFPALSAMLGSLSSATIDPVTGELTNVNAGAGGFGVIMGILAFLFAVVSLIPSIAVSIRRLHDTDRSGWWWWIGFVPVVGGFIFLVLMLLPSTPGRNQYGS